MYGPSRLRLAAAVGRQWGHCGAGQCGRCGAAGGSMYDPSRLLSRGESRPDSAAMAARLCGLAPASRPGSRQGRRASPAPAAGGQRGPERPTTAADLGMFWGGASPAVAFEVAPPAGRALARYSQMPVTGTVSVTLTVPRRPAPHRAHPHCVYRTERARPSGVTVPPGVSHWHRRCTAVRGGLSLSLSLSRRSVAASKLLTCPPCASGQCRPASRPSRPDSVLLWRSRVRN